MSAVFPPAMLALHGVASLAYVLYLFWHDERVARAGFLLLATGLAAHLGTIGSRCLAGHHPLADTSGVLSLSGLLLGVAFVAGPSRFRVGTLGAIVAPFVLVLAIGSGLTLPHGPRHVPRTPWLGELHLVLVALGVAAFALAAAVALIYLLEESALKGRRFQALARKGPAITTLDTLAHRLLRVGFVVYTLALVTGLAWLSHRPGGAGFRIDYVVAGAIWLTFAALIVARLTVGLRGRTAAVLTLVGFIAVAVVLVLYAGRRVFGA